MATDALVIKASKAKTLLIVIGAIVFVALGSCFLSLDAGAIESQHRFNNPTFVYAVGLASVILFGLCFVAGVWRMLSNKPGLELNSEGVRIFNIGQSLLVPWQEISGLSAYEVHNHKMLVINLYEPNKYINMGGKIRQSLARSSHNMCGSPISISPNSLKLNFQKLTEVCEHYFNRYGTNA